ncbi:MAG: hypothetical protein WCH46_00320 [bacterium]
MKQSLFILLVSLLLASCTSSHSSEQKKTQAEVIASSDHDAIDALLRCINDQSSHSCSLIGEGSITLKDGSSSQGGHFEIKSKRLTSAWDASRMDSLSMIVSGPFGITGVKFLGAPDQFHFYNAIEGENYHGKPDAKSLQGLTGMNGLSLEALNDVIYGLAPSKAEFGTGDSIVLTSSSDLRHTLFIRHPLTHFTEAITLTGRLPLSASEKPKLFLSEYEKWNRAIEFDQRTLIKPDFMINYEGIFEKKDFVLPSSIRATAGSTVLELEYTGATQNPKDLTVKIKMPKQ